ncbi:hypothetical protein SLS56_002052 [Neofusicoccum ribis]|uniref:F-box domain-containing protein n=1 Tax=Neofusicoccum ribis TaxID=45134 RepID=A0ABR3T6G4_9PEZI
MANDYLNRIAAKPKAFQVLPVELNQEIASNLTNDKDLVNFRAACRAARDAIDDQDSSWFKRFTQLYDYPANLHKNSPGYKAKIRKLYQKRSKYLVRSPPHFKTGCTQREEDTLKMVAELINDSYNSSSSVHNTFINGQKQLTSKNIEAFKDFISRSDIIDNIFRPRPSSRKPKKDDGEDEKEPQYSPLLAAIQILCIPTILKEPRNLYGFPDSQKEAYSTIVKAPIFGGFNKLEINMVWLLHVMNFFKYHIGNAGENTLFEPFGKLERAEKPFYWQGPIHNGPQELGVHWKGTYAYLDRDEMKAIRSGNPHNQLLMDRNVDHGNSAIQTMNIDIPETHEFPWPASFERHLQSITPPKPARTRAQHRSDVDDSFMYERINQRFQATGYDDEDFHAAGWLNELPNQQGIAGWKRMTMMKYFEDGQGGWDGNALWAYEGVVLPGGQIMLGRWWSPEVAVPGREVYTGPFIFWNTDAACDLIDCDLHGINDP